MSSPPVALSVLERGDERGPNARANTARRSSLAAWPGPASTLSTSRSTMTVYRPVRLPMRLAWVRGIWSSRGRPPGPGWRNPSPWRTIPPPMSLLAFLLVAQTATQADTVPPYLAFPEPGLDDPAAYEGYNTRVYQDASGNAFQVYVKGNTGRAVHLWADAANESVGFTVRDSSGRPAELAWGSARAVVAGAGRARTRSVSYGLELPSTVTIGLFLLGSMRVERDFQYAGRDSLPLGTPAFPQSELADLIDHIAKLKPAERARHLALLGVSTI